jgi:alkylated DNA repair dioxygenase AlkB
MPLFDYGQALPNGFTYHPNFLSEHEEAALIALFEKLPLKNAPYKEYIANRRILSFGWGYNEEEGQLIQGAPLPDFLRPIATRAAALAGIPKDRVVEALITEYRPGTGVGWHCDQESFQMVIGVSLGSWCRFDLRPLKSAGARDSYSLTLEPRSAYLMKGESRWSYQHRVEPTKGHRYSITFRTLPA